ncbi:MAG TPA: LysM domain-containing protein [Opitutaceae bacterium]|nr:LysM domain-containing protein [Opitutaceae bacterium]
MDTISRDNNTSYLPVAGVIAGLLALVLSVVALVKVSTANKTLETQAEKVAKIDGIESTANTAATTADRAAKNVDSLTQQTQKAVNDLGNMILEANGKITKIEEGQKKPAAAAGKSSGPVVAGPNEYVVKAGDTSGTKIAKANGVSLADLQAVNPGVDWSHLKIGQKLKLPKK